MNKKLIALSNVATLLALPVVALAFSAGNVPNAVSTLSIEDIIDVIFSIIWQVTVAFDIIIFIAAAYLFMIAQGDPTKLATARLAVLGGVVFMIIALVAFSIPFIVRNTIGQGI